MPAHMTVLCRARIEGVIRCNCKPETKETSHTIVQNTSSMLIMGLELSKAVK